MYVDFLNACKKISLPNKVILKHKKEISNLNSALYSLREVPTSLVDEHFNVFNTLVEKEEEVECVTCPTLKFEIENLKGQLTHVISLSTKSSTNSSDRGAISKKNHHVTRRNRKSISSKLVCHYYSDNCNIRPHCHIRKVKF